jgi:hypothetical protein
LRRKKEAKKQHWKMLIYSPLNLLISKSFIIIKGVRKRQSARELPLKSPRSQQLDYILDDVAVKISANNGYAVRNLFTVSGEKIKEGKFNWYSDQLLGRFSFAKNEIH